MAADVDPEATTSALRRDALLIFERAVDAADPERRVRRALERGGPELLTETQVGIVSFGKASRTMASAALHFLPESSIKGGISGGISGGIVVVDRRDIATADSADQLGDLQIVAAEHPVPGEGSLAAAVAVERFFRESKCDRFLVLVSGGASSLLCAPAEGIDLPAKQTTTDQLLRSGASIQEINTVRRHLSRIKGGNLARLLARRPARVLLLSDVPGVLSDVPGDELSAIASGPLAADPTTFADALEILERRGLLDSTPEAVLARLRAGAAGEFPENPGPGDPLLDDVENEIVGSNRLSVEAATTCARDLGYTVEVAPDPITGEARDVAKEVARRLRDSADQPRNSRPSPAHLAAAGRRAWVGGGETTVTVGGDGRGGRNQELALAFALAMRECEPQAWCLLSAGTDGLDGPTDAAGAIVDAVTLRRAAATGLDPAGELERNNSYEVLDAAGDLLRTGPTGTNVGDLQVLLVAADTPRA